MMSWDLILWVMAVPPVLATLDPYPILSKQLSKKAILRLGQCFLEQRSFPVAVTVLSRALHEPGLDDEQRVGVLYLLGYACEALQRRDEARGYFERVYATDINFRDVAERLTALTGSTP